METHSDTIEAAAMRSLYSNPLPQNYFRLLQWQPSPGQPSFELRFRLIEVPIDQAPSYNALSYRWQDPSATDTEAKLTCNDVEVRIGLNLWAALRQISTLPDRPAYLWVDCICIEQFNQEEKQDQILMMPQIYQQAQRVVIWLGPSTEESDKAPGGNPLTEDQAQTHQILLRASDYTPHPIFEEIWRLFDRDWFGRVWTLQEAALASDTCIVMCGGKTFPYSTLSHFADRYVNDEIGHWVKLVSSIRPISHGTDPENPWRPIMLHLKAVLKMRKAIELRAAYPAAASPIVKILNYLRPLDCTEPRDRILCITAFLPPDLIATLRAEGTLSAEALYKLYASVELGINQNIHCLAAAGLSQQKHSYSGMYGTNIDSRSLNLPSWVPDWTHRKRHEPFWILDDNLFESKGYHLYNATDDSRPTIVATNSADGSDIAAVKGAILDTIVDLGEPYHVVRIPAGLDTNEHPEVVLQAYQAQKEQMEEYISLAFRHFRPSTADVSDGISNLTVIRKTLIGNIVPEVVSSTFAGVWVKARPEQIDQIFEDLEDCVQQLNAECERKMNPPQEDVHVNYRKTQDADVTTSTSTAPKETAAKLGAEEPPNKRPNPLLTIGTTCKGRTLFVTRDGRVGVGPDIIAKGDQICIFYGARTPFVIRPVRSNSDGAELNPVSIGRNEQQQAYYQLVGECYVHGLMDGEVMTLEGMRPEDIYLV